MPAIRPQEGFQMDFLSTPADIAFGGGAAGVGKSFVLLMEPIRHVAVPGFGAEIFRRTMTQVKKEGSLWDTTKSFYPTLHKSIRPKPIDHKAYWRFPNGSKVSFSHLQYEKNLMDYQGAQIPLIGFDELTHFTQSQFFYMLTRNRTMCGVKPYTRATMNPQGRGWVKEMIEWYLYPDNYNIEDLSGYPIPERAGKLRYFTRFKSKLMWGNTPEEVIELLPYEVRIDYSKELIKSFTFIPGKLDDNQILLANDPTYKGNLLAQDEETMEQLLKGRWKALDEEQKKLFHYKALVDSFSNFFVDYGKKYITADIALEGSDKFVIIVWSGMRIEKIYTYPKSHGETVLNEIKVIARKHSVPRSHIAFDSDGIGGFLKGFLRSSVPFVNNAAPIDIAGQKQYYENLKTQCFYMLKDFINEYQLFIDCEDELTQDIIIEELYAHERAETKNGKLTIRKKDSIKAELGRSPDYADAIMMRMIFFLVNTKRKTSTTSY